MSHFLRAMDSTLHGTNLIDSVIFYRNYDLIIKLSNWPGLIAKHFWINPIVLIMVDKVFASESR